MDPFTYIPPTPITQPRYDVIRRAEATIRGMMVALPVRCFGLSAPLGDEEQQQSYELINHGMQLFHDMIGRVCPKSADTTAAQRCVRIARMAANEYASGRMESDPGSSNYVDNLRQCLDNLRAARWQACAAIALCPESDLPPWQPTP